MNNDKKIIKQPATKQVKKKCCGGHSCKKTDNKELMLKSKADLISTVDVTMFICTNNIMVISSEEKETLKNAITILNREGYTIVKQQIVGK